MNADLEEEDEPAPDTHRPARLRSPPAPPTSVNLPIALPHAPNVPVFSISPASIPPGARPGSLVPVRVDPPPPRLSQVAITLVPGALAMLSIVALCALGRVSGESALIAIAGMVGLYTNPPRVPGQRPMSAFLAVPEPNQPPPKGQ